MTHKKVAEEMIEFHLSYARKLKGDAVLTKAFAKQSALLSINSDLNMVVYGGKMNLYKSQVTKTMVFGEHMIVELKGIQDEIEKL